MLEAERGREVPVLPVRHAVVHQLDDHAVRPGFAHIQTLVMFRSFEFIGGGNHYSCIEESPGVEPHHWEGTSPATDGAKSMLTSPAPCGAMTSRARLYEGRAVIPHCQLMSL